MRLDNPTVLSYGGGVNSVALLLRMLREGEIPDLVVFADTGEERPETYAYIRERVAPYCAQYGIPFETVSKGQRLVDYYRENRVVPSIEKRDCSSKFKHDVVRRHLRSLGIKKATILIGIAWDESHRERKSDVQWLRNRFPLLEWRMTRKDCLAEIAAHGWPSPGKSACMGCPLGGKRGAVALLKEHPEEFARWRAMEEAGRRYPEMTVIPNVRLAWVERAVRTQRTLDLSGDPEDPGECWGEVCPV